MCNGLTLDKHVATVLTVYGIETLDQHLTIGRTLVLVATVLTVYGIETNTVPGPNCLIHLSLQQYLPFTVLKPNSSTAISGISILEGCNSTYRLRY